MAKPLDGIALSTYIRRLKLSKETRERLIHIRSSPPSRTPEARKGNMPVWYSWRVLCRELGWDRGRNSAL
jgi:hypothetical protein